jgi:hypothetical protein
MADMESIRGKYRRLRWVFLVQVIAVVALAPSEYREMIHDHANPWMIVWVTALGIGWNGMLLNLWWRSRPESKISN